MEDDTKLQNNFNEYIMKNIDDLKQAVAQIQVSIAELPQAIFDKSDERYASKTVEKVVYAVCGAVGLVIVYTLLSVAFKHPIVLPVS